MTRLRRRERLAWLLRQRERNPRWHDGLRTETVTRLARAGYATPDAIRAGLADGTIRPGFVARFGPRAYAEVIEVFGTLR
ncbi:hypothetical protein [Salinisphaera orenii]|uniref:Uncharacterized protein n=1 Tax=Salinisphaera orenii YIM 95161 TaxID=1051139 RepID=A0A423PQQ3_9GAMM|nr:hypothetical protein [Salinisphaera halophila]ROO27907.1 hypothetical protein SAHL_11070 [Salinisphaera halophila YIM 95161]